jgi:hypothetical protein
MKVATARRLVTLERARGDMPIIILRHGILDDVFYYGVGDVRYTEAEKDALAVGNHVIIIHYTSDWKGPE